jgi:Ca2+-transporting ATPase
VLCNDAEVRPPDADHGSWWPIGDPTEAALLALAAKGHVEPDALDQALPRIAEIPFDSVRKRTTTVHQRAEPASSLVVCKGAPDILLDGRLVTDGPLAQARAAAADLARHGFRVLAVADREVTGTPRLPDAEQDPRLVGLVAITDPVRAAAAQVVESFRTAGVDLLLITGDAPGTAGAVAERLGIGNARC